MILVTSNNHGSAIELGENLSKELRKIELTECISRSNLKKSVKNIRKEKIVYIKYFHLESAIDLLNQGNDIYFFIVDKYPEEFLDFDFKGLIFSNKKQSEDFSKFFKCENNYIYYHHYSPFYKTFNQKTKKIGYFVAPENCSCLLKSSNLIDTHHIFDLYKEIISEYFFHIEYREKDTLNFKYKPCAKLSTSVYSESVFICSKDDSYSELLPSDYPYFLEKVENIEYLNLKINDFIQTMNKEEFKYSIDLIKKLKEYLNISNTSKKLYEFLKS